MNRATRAVAALIGIAAGLAGIEHGYFEARQGAIALSGLMFPSMGPPCVPEAAWNACEPALTILPTYLITGIVSIIVGAAIVIWSAAFIQRKHGGLVLMLLSVALLLFGGGIFPPVIAFIAGLVSTRINTPLIWWRTHLSDGVVHFLAALWPWPLAIFLLWSLVGQWAIGYYFNNFLQRYAVLSVLVIIGSLVLAPITGFAHDILSNMAPITGQVVDG